MQRPFSKVIYHLRFKKPGEEGGIPSCSQTLISFQTLVLGCCPQKTFLSSLQRNRTELPDGLQPPTPVIWGQIDYLSPSFSHLFGSLCSDRVSLPFVQRAHMLLGPGVRAPLASSSSFLLALGFSELGGSSFWPMPHLYNFIPLCGPFGRYPGDVCWF